MKFNTLILTRKSDIYKYSNSQEHDNEFRLRDSQERN